MSTGHSAECQSVRTGAVWKNGNLVLLEEDVSPEIKAAEKKMKAEFIKSDLEAQHRFAIVNNRTRSLKIAY